MRARVQVPTGSGLQHVGAAGSASDVIARLPEGMRTLPRDIDTLFDLANNSFPLFELPPPFGAMAKAHGLDNLQFPCQVGAGYLTKLATAGELAERLRAAENMHASFKGSVNDCVMTTYRCAMVGALALNVVSAAQLLSYNYQNPQSISAIGFAGVVVPAMVHGMIFKNLSEVQRKLRSLDRTDLSEHGALEAGNQDVAQLVRQKLRQLEAGNPADMVRMLLAMLALMAANFVIAKAVG